MEASELQQLNVELHKPTRKPKQYRQILSNDKDAIWSIDLVHLRPYAEFNDGYQYILVAVDIFTRYAWAVATRRATSAQVWTAMKKILTNLPPSHRPPQKIHADQGGEFLGGNFKKGLEERGIELYSTFSNPLVGAAHAERFIRTLKTNLFKACFPKFDWLQYLPRVMKTYNNTKHSAINMTPTEASDLDAEGQQALYNHQYPYRPSEPPALAVGDNVRVARLRGPFEKSYFANWSYLVYTIHKVKRGPVPMYYLREPPVPGAKVGDDVPGGFYASELQKVERPQTYLVEKVLEKKGYGQRAKYLVKWLGIDSKFNSWVKASDIGEI